MMVDSLKIYLFQYDIVWENRPANHHLVTHLLAETKPATGSLVVLPEMFDTGYSMNTDYTAGPDAQSSIPFLKNLAIQHQVNILAGIVTPSSEHPPQNQSILINSEGDELIRYSKIHSFTFAGEDNHYQSGQQIVTTPINNLTLCPLICYDLRFPETFRAAVTFHHADTFIVIANFPATRHDHWQTLLKARAIENQSYVIAVNRVGSDPLNTYAGGSTVIDPVGQILAIADDQPAVLTTTIDAQRLNDYRKQFPVLSDIRTNI